LNFVNNFADLSVELLDELKETPAIATLDEDKRGEVDETLNLLTSNLEKIAEHGKRADNIVKSMLEHSRGVSGERREVDLNALIDEALNLAYHGARAHDKSFSITLERDFDQTLPKIELAPQEITRVFLNLFGNGFYAANKRARENGNGSFQPALTVATAVLAMQSRSPCVTTAQASRLRLRTSCSSRSSRPSRPARAPASACQSATTSLPNSTVARSGSRASPARLPSSPCVCHATSKPQHEGLHERQYPRGR